MTLECPADGCISLHPHGHSLAMHLFKSEDEPHQEWDELDEAQAEVYRRDDLELNRGGTVGDDGPEPSPDGRDVDDGEPRDADRDEPSPTPRSDTVDDGPAAAPEVAGDDTPDVSVDTVEQDAATDGGRQAPPEPDEPVVPDHFVPVEEFIADVEAEMPEELKERDEWQSFVEDITGGDESFVDVDASNVEAGEVETADV